MTYMEGFRGDRSRKPGKQRAEGSLGGEEMETAVCAGREDSAWETGAQGGCERIQFSGEGTLFVEMARQS